MQIDPRKLVEARLARAMSQEEAAIATDLSGRTIQRIEAGQPASLESTKALLTVFGVDIICDPEPAPVSAQPSPWPAALADLKQQSRHWANLGFGGFRLLFVVNFVLVALAKLAIPQQTGLFMDTDGFAIGTFRRVPTGAPEVLGYWIIPVMLIAASLVAFSFGAVRRAIRQLAL